MQPLRSVRPTTTRLTLAALAAVSLAGCSLSSPQETASSGEETQSGSQSVTLTLVTHDSFALSEGILEGFEADTGIQVELVAPGDGGELANQLVLTKDSPLGDVVYGIDNTYASRAVDAGVFLPYTSPNAAADQDTFDGNLTAIDQGDVCLNIDPSYFEEASLAEPVTLEDIAEPEYAALTVVINPATSSPGMAFLLATIGEFGEDGWQDYWKQLLDGGAKVADGWSDVYYVDFSGSADSQGTYPIVVSYGSSPAAEIGDDGQPRTASLPDTCFRQVEYAGILAGTEHEAEAQQLVDFLLSDTVQDDIPGSMYMYPVSATATLPDEWAQFAPLASNPIEVDPALISEKRSQWLEEWLALVSE